MNEITTVIFTFSMSLFVSIGAATYLILWTSLPPGAKKQRGPVVLQILWIGSKIMMLIVGLLSSSRSVVMMRGADTSDYFTANLWAGVWAVMAFTIFASVTKLVWDIWTNALQIKLDEISTFQLFLDNSINRAARRMIDEIKEKDKPK